MRHRDRRGTPQTARIRRLAAVSRPSPFPRRCRNREPGCSAPARGRCRRGDAATPVSSRPFGEGVLAAERLGEIAEDVEIVARLADRVDRLMHRDDKPVARRAADVVAFERGRRRQHDIGMARRRRPPWLVHDDRLRALPGAAQPVQILVVVERVAAGPIDQPDIGIGRALAVVVVARAGIEQAIRDARSRYREPRRIGQRPASPGRGIAAAARPDWRRSHSRSQSRRPAIRSGRDTRQAAPAPNRAARRGRRAAATRMRSASCAYAAICRARSRIVSAGTPVIAAAHAASFGWPSVSPVRYGSTRAESRCSSGRESASSWRRSAISVCASASIIAVSVLGRIAIHSGRTASGPSSRIGLTLIARTPASRERRQRAAGAMPGAPTLGDLRVLRVGAAEHDEQPGMPRDRRPRGQRPGDRLRAAEDMRQKGQRGPEAVVAGLVDKAARGGEKSPQLPARLVKMTGRGPAPANRPSSPTGRARAARAQARRRQVRALAPTRPARTARGRGPGRSPARPSANLRASSGERCAVGECTESGIASISGEGSGSKSNGTAPTTLPSSTTALNAPQWEWCGTSLRFIAISGTPRPKA